MPLFKKAIVEELPPPSSYDVIVKQLHNIKEQAMTYVPFSMDEIVDNIGGVYIMSIMFVICAFVLVAVVGQSISVSSPLDDDEEIEVEKVAAEAKALDTTEQTTKVPATISMDGSEVTDLTAELMTGSSSSSSSSGSSNNEDDDDQSVEESYKDFVAFCLKAKSFDNDEENKAEENSETTLETPTASPPATPERRESIADDEVSSRRTSFKKRLSSKLSSGSFKMKRVSSSNSVSSSMSSNSIAKRSLSFKIKRDSIKE